MAVDNGQPVEATYTNSRLVSKTSLTTQTIQGPISQTNATDSTSVLTGALKTAGGLGVSLAAWIGGIFRVTNTTASTSTSTGAAVITGGLGVGGAAHIGGSAVIGGDMQATGAASASNLSGTNTGDVTFTNVGSTPNGDGASISGQQITLQPADALSPGLMTADAQEFSGDKTFMNNVEIIEGLIVQGDLTVNGTLTSVNSETLDVTDANITINNGGNDVSAEGSGITIDRAGTSGSLVYQNALASKFKAGALGSESEIITASTAQTMSGIKTFSADAIFQAALRAENEINSTSTGSNVTLVPTKTVHVVTNASLVSVREISAQNNQLIVLINRTGVSIDLVDDTAGSFTSGILTGTGSNLTLANNASVLLSRVEYAGPSHRFHVIGGSGSSSSFTPSRAIVSDSLGMLSASSTTSTEIGYLSGVTSNIQSQINAITSDGVPTGSVISYAGTSAPTNFLLCYGQAISRSTYSNLFSVIGVSFGSGDGSSTFNIPDLRGRLTAGKDDMGGSAAGRLTSTTISPNGNTLGASGGSQTHTLITNEMPSHTHIQNLHSHGTSENPHAHQIYIGSSGSGQQSITASGIANSFRTPGLTAGSTTAELTGLSVSGTTATNQNTGGGAAHNNVQPSLVLNYIIRI